MAKGRKQFRLRADNSYLSMFLGKKWSNDFFLCGQTEKKRADVRTRGRDLRG